MKITQDATVEEAKEKTKDTMIGMCFIEGSKQEKQTLAEAIRKQIGINGTNQAMDHLMQKLKNRELVGEEFIPTKKSQESVLKKVKR